MITTYQHWERGGTLNIENMTKYKRCDVKIKQMDGLTNDLFAQYINKCRLVHIKPLMFHFSGGRRDATAEAVD